MKKKKVLLIGWDAADWKAINPLLDQGLMPNLESLINGGVMGDLMTLDPPLSPTLWTSISTGKRPFKHGILGFVEPDPTGTSVRPVHITSRKVKAIWNILMQSDYKVHQVGWWPSHPAEPINGVYVSNFYQRANQPITEPWPMPDETVHPPEKSDIFAALRLHPEELTGAHLLPFIPNGAKLDQTNPVVQNRINSLRKIIADCTSIHSAATYIMDREEWDFLAVYYDAIDHFGHGFMKFHPPKRDHIPQDQFDAFYNVVTAGYRYHDMMLGTLLRMAGKDTTVILVSDHGFHPDHLRPDMLPLEPAGPAWEHSPYGIFVMKGPNVKKDERLYGASLLDVTPTLLAHLDLPVALDMDGKVLVTAFEQKPEVKLIESWEKVPGNCGMHDPNRQEDAKANQEAIDQLVALGYIEPPGPDIQVNIQNAIDDQDFYLARSYIDAGKYSQAIPILQRLHEDYPDRPHFAHRLVNCYLQTRQTALARDVVQALRAQHEAPSITLLKLQAAVVMQEGNPEKAIEYLLAATETRSDYPGLQLQLGLAYQEKGELNKALESFKQAIEFDSKDEHAYHAYGKALLEAGEAEKAAEMLLDAINLRYFTPQFHFDLGRALYELKEYKEAAQAFRVTLHIMPGFIKAKEYLLDLYSNHLNRPRLAAQIQAQLPDYKLPEIVIVSGLPRSGTSLMMQMLEAGGIPSFTDDKRSADENNPKGYYEHEAVKSLAVNQNFLKDVGNKAVKIIAQLLFQLPPNFRYKVIFMERDLGEVLQSQHQMLQREGKINKNVYSFKLFQTYHQTIEKVKQSFDNQPNFQFLFVEHRQAIDKPEYIAKRVQQFLDRPLDVEKMASVVDKGLYREKSTEDSTSS